MFAPSVPSQTLQSSVALEEIRLGLNTGMFTQKLWPEAKLSRRHEELLPPNCTQRATLKSKTSYPTSRLLFLYLGFLDVSLPVSLS